MPELMQPCWSKKPEIDLDNLSHFENSVHYTIPQTDSNNNSPHTNRNNRKHHSRKQTNRSSSSSTPVQADNSVLPNHPQEQQVPQSSQRNPSRNNLYKS